MKNLFSWSVVVSALTIYLYWYGYWYTEGYIRYFGHDIRAYDIPLQHIIVAGALQSLVLIFKLMMVLILISFLLQFSKNQYARFFKIIEIGLLYIWFNIIGLLKVMLLYIVGLFFKIMEINWIIENKSNCVDSINKYMKLSVNFFTYIKDKLKNVTSKVVQNANSIIDFNRGISNKKIIKVEGINAEIIKNKIKKEDAATFDIQYFLHVLIMFTVVPFLLVSLDYTNEVNEDGFDDAHKSFKCSIIDNKKGCKNYYSQISLIEEDLQIGIEEPSTTTQKQNQTWYLTDICLNRRCLVFNKNRVAKFIDVTDKEILIK